MLRLAFDFIITWRETRTRPNAYYGAVTNRIMVIMFEMRSISKFSLIFFVIAIGFYRITLLQIYR